MRQVAGSIVVLSGAILFAAAVIAGRLQGASTSGENFAFIFGFILGVLGLIVMARSAIEGPSDPMAGRRADLPQPARPTTHTDAEGE